MIENEGELRNESKEFFKSISNNNVAEIKKFFRNESIKPWEFLLDEDYSGLHRAVFLDLFLVVCTMIDEMKIRLGIDAQKEIEIWVNQKTKKEGNTAIHFASYVGNIDIIERLIKFKANIEISNFNGNNVLHMAAKGNNPNSIIYFKEKYNMDIESVDELESTPLHRACFYGADLSTNFILSFNVNINYRDREGYTPLHLAVMAGTYNLFYFLENKEIIKKLLQKGANRLIKDNQGRTPYDIAASNNKKGIIDMLKETNNCQIFTTKTPLQKLEKNKFNLFIFYSYYFFSGFTTVTLLIPYCLYSDNKIRDAIYLTIFILIIIFYTILIFLDPGKRLKNKKESILLLVENKVEINKYCPTCMIKKEQNDKHCLICDVCINEFNHHCNWMNNCVGKNNVNFYWIFLILICANIIFNIEISIEALIDDNPKRSMFYLGEGTISDDISAKIIGACSVFLSSFVLMFPIFYIFYYQTRLIFGGGFNKMRRSILSRMNSKTSQSNDDTFDNISLKDQSRHTRSLLIKD